MYEAGLERPGAMAAILGLSAADAEAACAEAAGAGIVRAANLNAPGQVVISGEPAAVNAACERAKAKGAKRAIPLEVSGAFHSPLMEPAAKGLAAALAAVPIRDARCPIVSNAWARPVQGADEIRQALEEQLLSSVRWEESMRWLRAQDVEAFVELGTGKVLRGLLRTIDGEARSWNVEDPDSLAATLAALAGAGRNA
jgi:[acyl-carrier-protein] S-malonyltransferase